MAISRTFRLERVLRLREQREKDLQGQLARVYQRQLEQQGLLGAMEENRATQAQMITAELNSPRVEMTYLQFGSAYLERLQNLIDRQTNVVKQAAKTTSEKRVEVHQAMKARKVLEKLREHWRDDLQDEVRQREIKLIDEISTVQFNIRQASS